MTRRTLLDLHVDARCPATLTAGDVTISTIRDPDRVAGNRGRRLSARYFTE
jgi:hypothetical protein